MEKQAIVDAAALERARVELAVPAHMLVLMSQEVGKRGWSLRADVVHYLNNASVVPLQGLDQLSVARVARRVDDVSRALLHALSPDEPVRGLLSVAYFVLKLVDEGLFDDPKNQAVLASLLVVEEAKHELEWRFNGQRLQVEAENLLLKARLMGLYFR